MAGLLARLLRDSETGPAAIPAIPAILGTPPAQRIAESQESQGGDAEKAKEQRARLLALAADEVLPAGLVHGLADADAVACAGLPDDTLRAYLLALEAGQQMDAGMVPPGWGEPVARTCEGCGPVLLWPGCPPKVKACPWCFRRKAGKAIPRPLVACGDCRHFTPDTVNPPAGMGGCGLGHPSRWPMQRHRCGDWRLRRPGGQSGLRQADRGGLSKVPDLIAGNRLPPHGEFFSAAAEIAEAPQTTASAGPSSERLAVTLAVTAHRKTGKPAQLGACSLLLCRGYPEQTA